jgi:hypothetical protein
LRPFHHPRVSPGQQAAELAQPAAELGQPAAERAAAQLEAAGPEPGAAEGVVVVSAADQVGARLPPSLQ